MYQFSVMFFLVVINIKEITHHCLWINLITIIQSYIIFSKTLPHYLFSYCYNDKQLSNIDNKESTITLDEVLFPLYYCYNHFCLYNLNYYFFTYSLIFIICLRLYNYLINDLILSNYLRIACWFSHCFWSLWMGIILDLFWWN